MLDIGVVFGMVGDDYNMSILSPLLLSVVAMGSDLSRIG